MMKEQSFEWEKQGQVYRVQLRQQENGFGVSIEDTRTQEAWSNEFTEQFVAEISQKAGRQMAPQELYELLRAALKTLANIDLMSAFELESLKVKRGGQPSAQNKKSNKKYLILTVGGEQKGSAEQKVHYPLPLQFRDTVTVEQMKQMIRALKNELDSCKDEEKTNSSISSVLNASAVGENIRQQNERLKQAVKELEEQQAQKRGAVEHDQAVRERNDLELKAETVKREENKEIAKLRTVHAMKEKELADMRAEIQLIRRELDVGQEGSTKLKSHIMRVVKASETELNNARKTVAKQQKELANQLRNLQTARQNEKKLQLKVKQVQAEIDQAKKKLSTREISNRLHSPSSSKKSSSSAPNKPVANRVIQNNKVVGNLVQRTTSNRSDNSSNASSTKPRSYNGPIKANLIKPSYNYNYKPAERDRRISDPLTRTTPALKVPSSRKDQVTLGSTKFSPNRTTKPPVPSYVPPVRNLSPADRAASLHRLTQPRVPVTKPPVSKPPVSNTKPPIATNKPQPFRKPLASQPKVPSTRELTQKQKNIFSKIDEIKSKLQNCKKP